MYAIRKPKGDSTDVFVAFPPNGVGQWRNGKQEYTPLVEWLMEHSVEDGFRDGRVVGVYLTHIDAVAFKLKFGL